MSAGCVHARNTLSRVTWNIRAMRRTVPGGAGRSARRAASAAPVQIVVVSARRRAAMAANHTDRRPIFCANVQVIRAMWPRGGAARRAILPATRTRRHDVRKFALRQHATAAGLVVACITALHGDSNPPLLLQKPTLSRAQIAFVYAGDLWTVPRERGDARRLPGTRPSARAGRPGSAGGARKEPPEKTGA